MYSVVITHKYDDLIQLTITGHQPQFAELVQKLSQPKSPPVQPQPLLRLGTRLTV